ncbi:MAG: hypothetical protein C0401_09945 [Anaerolinea sp.]|nr:hypothetical protein [Anaerolinea sp.]
MLKDPGYLIDLSGRQPQWPESIVCRWQKSHESALRDSDVWRTPPHEGDLVLRQILGEILEDDFNNIIITAGVRSAAFSLVCHGDIVYHEYPTFRGTVQALESAGAIVELREWREMASTSSLQENNHFIWITSPCRNPDGVTLSSRAITRFSQLNQRKALIVINETYRWYGKTTDQIPNSIRVGSFSKIASGGSRLGWIRGSCIGAEFLTRHHSLPPMLWQRTWAYFLKAGGLCLLMEHIVKRAEAARRAFFEIVRDDLSLRNNTSGPSMLYFLSSTDEGTAVAKCLEQRLLTGMGRDFLSPKPALRICFTDIDVCSAMIAGQRFLRASEAWKGKLGA